MNFRNWSRRLAKRVVTQVAIVMFVGVYLLILHSVPWAKIAPTILTMVAMLVAIFFFLYWRNHVTFVWPTEFGEEARTINRPLRRALDTQFSGYLKKYGFKLISDPSFDKNVNFWMVMFRSEFFDLSFGDRPDVLVKGRPRYCQEDWYSIPAVFALLDGVDNFATDDSDLDRLAKLIDERHSELCDFFSPQGDETRLRYAQWVEKRYRRMWGRDSVPRDTA